MIILKNDCRDVLVRNITKDEYYLMVYEDALYSWDCLKYKYRVIIKKYNLSKEDVVQDIMVKLLKPRKDGLTYYDVACSKGWSTGCIRSFVYRVVSGYLIDYQKIKRNNFSIVDMYDFLGGIEKLDNLRYIPENLIIHEDLDAGLRIDELISMCSGLKKQQKIKGVIIDVLKGLTLNEACRNNGIGKQAFMRQLELIKIRDFILG